jgi:signal transduction histidine kinase
MGSQPGLWTHGPLVGQLRWFIRLRWLAALTVIAGALIDWQQLHWYGRDSWLAGLGGIILLYNLVLSGLMRPFRATKPQLQNIPPAKDRKALRTRLLLLAWVQILLDLLCLMLLVLWTGGIASPLLGFFVFHMVFASLLLPRVMAYAGAVAAIALVVIGLRLSAQWPEDRPQLLLLYGWIVTLLLTVHLSNRITRALRRQRRRLVKQNKHIRAMSRQLQRQQQAMAQHEKMVALGQMAAGVAHEIANPLASMDSVLQLLHRNPQRMNPQTVQTLREQVERIRQIIVLMKSFAHPAEMQGQILPLNEVVEQAIHMVHFDPRLRITPIERQLSPDAGALPLLPQAIQQVLVNLILNALDALEGRENGKIMIRTARQDQWRLVEIADNGPGIEPEHIKRLFEPFFTTKPVGKGTGLGLAISYSLVQKQGGNITCQSECGKGTRFTIKLPAGEM